MSSVTELLAQSVQQILQLRPRAIREYDQIHMRAADLILNLVLLSDLGLDKHIVFMGDSDAVTLCLVK